MAKTIYTAEAHVTGGREHGHGGTTTACSTSSCARPPTSGDGGHQPRAALRRRLRRLLRGRARRRRAPREARPRRRRDRLAVSLITTEDRGYTVAVKLDVTLPDVPDGDAGQGDRGRRAPGVPVLQRHPRQHRRRAGGQRPAGRLTDSSPIRWARCTASARLRACSLRYRALVCSLTVCGDRNSCSAISRLVEPAAMRSSTSRSRSESIGAGCSAVGSNTVIPSPTIRTARATSRASQSLETKPDAPAARAAAATSAPRRRSAAPASTARPCGSSRTRRRPTRRPGTGRPARRRRVAAGQHAAPRRRCAPPGSAPPTAARRAATRKPQCTTSWSSTTSTRSLRSARRPGGCGWRRSYPRLRQRHHEPDPPQPLVRRAEVHHAAVLQRLEGRQAQPHARAPRAGPGARRRCGPPG